MPVKRWIDSRLAHFLDLLRFVAQVTGRRPQLLLPLVLVVVGSGFGCSPQSAPGPVEDSLTSGRISVVCAPEAASLIARERSAFQDLYPQVSTRVTAGRSREAIRALFAAECDLAAITRELTAEERAAAVRGKLELEGYRFARDAVVAVVNPANPVENLSVDDLAKVYRGEITRWSEIGGRDLAIEPVTQPSVSDITEYFIAQVMGGEAMQARVLEAESDSAVVAMASSRPGAIGYVSLAWADRGVRALRLSSLTGLNYQKPDLEAVYKGDYPLTRFYNFYMRPRGAKAAAGFVTFVTSMEGQAIVHEAGLVPTAVPVRFVRRSPMLGTH